MRVVNFTEARNNLKNVLDNVTNDADYTIITRRDSEDTVVMPLDVFNSWTETMHVLGSAKNIEHLEKSIAQHKANQIHKRDMIDE